MRSATLVLFLLPLLAACTSPELRGTNTVFFRVDAPSTHDVLPYSLQAVWTALPRAFADLDLPGGVPRNSSGWEFTTPQLRVRSPLYQRQNSDFIDCGKLGGPRRIENQGEILLAVITRLEESGPSATIVRTQLDAYARWRDASSDYVPCRSRGLLERGLLEALQARLRAAATPADE